MIADVLQQWIGVVRYIDQNVFGATLEATCGEDGDLFVEIYINRVQDDQRLFIKPGAVFWWTIGDVNKSEFKFVDEGKLTPEEIVSAKEWAEAIRRLFSN